jgi:hypothetical protein
LNRQDFGLLGSKALVRDHFNSDGITYAGLLKADDREKLVEVLDKI